MIKINKLNKYFNKRKANEIHVINDVSLRFPETGLVVLLGESGSGKTTLLNVIGGLDKVENGELQVAGTTFKKYNSKKWDSVRNKHIGYIFQNYNLLKDLSVFENVAFVLNMIGIYDKTEVEKRVNYILQAVNMFKFRKKKASELSGGQQQRVAIARALVKNPKIIIADEPTGNLDSANTLDVMNIIKEISKEKLVVLVTHDREIAKFYGDRIIEIQDGKVISDNENEQSENHNFSTDNVIYLKDLEMAEGKVNDNVNIEVYSDDKFKNSKFGVKLIVKNNTLYLDVNSPLKNVKLLSDETGVVVKDEHYKPKSRENVIETAFNLDYLNNENVVKTSKSTISFKKSFNLAFNKIKQFGKRGKLMLFAFIICGIQISFAGSLFFGAVNQPVEGFMSVPKNAVHLKVLGKNQSLLESGDSTVLNKTESENLYNKLMQMPNVKYINTLNSTIRNSVSLSAENPLTNDKSNTFVFYSDNYDFNSISLHNVTFDVVSNVNKNQLVLGKMPENDFEFLIDSKHVDETFNKYTSPNINGVWSTEGLFNLNFKYAFDDVRNTEQAFNLKIVGVVNSGSKNVFFTETMANLISNNQIIVGSKLLPYYLPSNFAEQNVNDIVLTAGQNPSNENEVLYSETYFKLLTGIDPISNSIFPYTYNLIGDEDNDLYSITISGLYTSKTIGENYLIASNEYINKDRFIRFTALTLSADQTNIYETANMQNNGIFLNTTNPQSVISAVSQLNEYNNKATWSFEQALEEQSLSVKSALIGISVGVIVILAFTSIGFYFLIRSSLMTRIYEISVYRALGVNKKDIYKSFLVEITLITIITSLVGFILGTYGAIEVSKAISSLGSFGGGFMLSVNFMSVLVGLIAMFSINYIFGLLPVIMLLRKTPSQILSKYDI